MHFLMVSTFIGACGPVHWMDKRERQVFPAEYYQPISELPHAVDVYINKFLEGANQA
jgi:hypothetical protein